MTIPLEDWPFDKNDLKDHVDGIFRTKITKNNKVYRCFREVECLRVERGHHSNVYVLRLFFGETEQEQEEVNIAVKEFLTPKGLSDELEYRWDKDPSRLFMREKMAYRAIKSQVNKNLVPPMLGEFRERLFSLTEYLTGFCLNNILIDVTNKKDWKAKNFILLNALRNLARFDGECNARESIFDMQFYNDQVSVQEGLYESNYKNYLTRLYCNAKGLEIEGGVRFLSDVMVKLRTRERIDLGGEVEKLMLLKKFFDKKQVLQHGEYNLLHIYYPEEARCGLDNKWNINLFTESKVIDLEKFGKHSSTRDLVTLFMGGADNVALLYREELERLVGFYLGWEYGFRQQKEGVETEVIGYVDNLSNLENKNIYNYLTNSIMEQKDYADFLLAFFANSIEEGIHLHATHARYSEERMENIIEGLEGYSVDQLRECKGVYVKALLEYLADDAIGRLAPSCSSEQAVRDYFYQQGSLLRKLGIINLDSSVLKKIKG